MEREDYLAAIRPWAGGPAEVRNVGFGQLAGFYSAQPLSKWEKGIACENLAKAEGLTWYHGGLAGRAVGDRLLPPRVTGLDPRGFGNAVPARAQYFYVTYLRAVAAQIAHHNELKGHASRVYKVGPVGPISVDPEYLRRGIMYVLDPGTDTHWPQGRDWGFSSYGCGFARVTAVLKVREMVE